MVQGFYNLDEAAQRLGMRPEDLTQMAQRREVRAFADRGTWRFRTQDIEELARQRGLGSDPAAPVGSGPKTPAPMKGADVFPFELDSGGEQDFGTELFDVDLADSKRVPGPVGSESEVRRREPRPASEKQKGKAPEPDSGPKLVIESPSSVRLGDQPIRREGDSVVPIGREGDMPRGESNIMGFEPGTPEYGDSGVRLVEDEAPASRVGRRGAKRTEIAPTDEINLDEELLRAQDPSRQAAKSSQRITPSPIPFEIPEDEEPTAQAQPPKKPDSSGEIDLAPGRIGTESIIDIDLGGAPSDSDLTRASGTSGINLQSPADSGISLEKEASSSAEDISFELSLDDAPGATPRPVPAKEAPESSSEFELTLDEGGGLAPVDEEKRPGADSDFSLPDLGDESDSEVKGLADSDTDMESSDFELALDEEDASAEGDTGSEVIVIDEDVGEGDKTAVRPQLVADEGLIADEGDLEVVSVAGEDEEAEAAALAAAAAQAAPVEWGWFPAVCLLPTTIVLLLIGALLFEMLNGVWSYGQPTFLGGQIADMFGKMMK